MMDDKDWELFKKKLDEKTGIDLQLYKEPQMKRRIGNLVTRAEMDSFVAYFDKVSKTKDDFAEFIEYLTINVSEFFRNPDKFDKIEKEIIPYLMKSSPKLNIWSAGCSIGAEPYSLSIIMKELTPNVRHRILATDLDIDILAKAKKGVYNDNEIKALKPDRKSKYFTKTTDGKWAVKPEIKSAVEWNLNAIISLKISLKKVLTLFSAAMLSYILRKKLKTNFIHISLNHLNQVVFYSSVRRKQF